MSSIGRTRKTIFGRSKKVVPESAESSDGSPAARTVNLKTKNDVDDAMVDEFLQKNFHSRRKVRALTVSQLNFRKAIMRRSPQEELRKQITEKHTHYYLATRLCLIAVLSIVVICYGSLAWQGELANERSPVAGPIFVTAGVLQASTALLGAYGAKRVRKDIAVDLDGLGMNYFIVMPVALYHLFYALYCCIVPRVLRKSLKAQ